MKLSKISYEPTSDRTLFTTFLNSFQDPIGCSEIRSRYFVCLLVGDFSAASDRDIMQLAEGLLESGACYFMCWGSDCERCHDLVDSVVHGKFAENDDAVVITTWHDGDTLEDTLWEFLCVSSPVGLYEEETRSALAVVVGDVSLYRRIVLELKEPSEFINRILDKR